MCEFFIFQKRKKHKHRETNRAARKDFDKSKIQVIILVWFGFHL
jgi:sugar phosphate permease